MKHLRLIFCGDRAWRNRRPISETMATLKLNLGEFTVVEGEAPGADSMSRSVAELEHNLPVSKFPADWDLYGKAAGSIRNTQMLKERGGADGVVAFHMNIDQSKGTLNMLQQAQKAGIPNWLFTDGPQKLAEFILELKRRQNA